MLTPENIAQIGTVVRETVRGEIAASEERFRKEIGAFEERIRAEMKALEERMQELVRTIETNLLTSFHGYRKGQTARQHTTEVAMADLATRMEALEERMLNLENPPTELTSRSERSCRSVRSAKYRSFA
jgi:hypothetical protein